jgi:hypothetical protein
MITIANIVHPFNLKGCIGYECELTTKTVFCWRWFSVNAKSTGRQKNFRVITLEDDDNE